MKKNAAVFILLISLALLAPIAGAQGSRKDDVVFGPTGHPVAGATVQVCQTGATGTPCSPLATIYTDATMTVSSPNPFQTDGIGNYHFYAPAGRYVLQISGPGITGTITTPDVILPPDVSSGLTGSDISAFGLTLGGNLSVAGNAAITGTLTTSNFSPATLTPSSLQVGGNGCFAGPRPYIDVTCPPYGAKGDGVTDDTTAITNAINAACANTVDSNAATPTVAFPAGLYVVDQTQGSSTTPDLPSCGNLHLTGLGNGPLISFGTPTQTYIFVKKGSNPSAAPVFSFLNQNGITVENLGIDGYNQVLWFNNSVSINLVNTCLRVATTGQTDNTPLKLTNVFDFWAKGGCWETISSGGATTNGALPVAIWDGETNGSSTPIVYLVHVEDTVLAGGPIHYSQRVNTSNCSSFWTFKNILREASTSDFILITNDTGNPASAAFGCGVGPIDIDNFTDSDSSGTTQAVINFNPSGSYLTGVKINHAANLLAGWAGAAIRMTGTGAALYNVSITGCKVFCATGVFDANGNPTGPASSQNINGNDYVVDTSDPSRLRTDIAQPSDNSQSGPALRLTPAGQSFAQFALDPAQGALFADGASYGYTAQLTQSAAETLDVGFSKTLPPTGVTATPASGGTLANGTYYYFVVPVLTGFGGSCAIAAVGAPSLVSSGATTTTGNNTVNISWTLPPAAPGTLSGFCIIRNTLPSAYGASTGLYVSGASTTSATDTGSNFGAGVYSGVSISQMQAFHRFTPTSLGVNTTSPQFNLDVNGAAAVNSLNGVQKAERFAGSDAAAKINACLTAASTSSGVCDARGFTGTLTGATHITVPAGTTLIWGQGQLTVTDSTTHDAVELTGDGASVIGQQESGLGTVPRAATSGYIACGGAGCTTIDNPNAATRNVDWVHIQGMYLLATGASSTVLNMTSVGHADIENNRFILGTGGSSYGIYGNTSTGNQDSTNSLIKHNEFDPQTTGDTCAYLAGVFNVVVLEQNSCYLAPGAGQGFVLAKDSNGNYPNNDEFYGNDCETGSTAFNQICYNIIGAQSVVIGPNNRCENVYNCFQFPADGSAVGIHLLDPYISLSANTVVKPNEPSTAMVAVDNNGHNWLPSMHFGLNDNSGPNLLGNAAFEGWGSSTALYYWGGVTGTSINQAGSGIYAQNAASGSPTADTFTQGTYNVVIGDNATAGLGINSACIQVDATLNYTLAFRIAASSTGIHFRPGFRFYSDANCTEGNRITSASSNARVLTPANYAGDSNTAIGGANWQSTNASLTYNNGITCNCNVTGADWNVGTANLWTASRNYAITFRIPNAYTSSATITHSMRVFILENTAANPNKIYVDDIVLSQGAVSPNIPLPELVSSTNPTVYGNLAVSGSLTAASVAGNASTASALASTPTQCGTNNFATGVAASGNANCAQPAFSNLSGSISTGQLPSSVTLTTGSPTASDCASFTGANVQDSGSSCPALFTKYAMGFVTGGQAPSANNAVDTSVIYLPNIQFSKITVDVSTADSSTSDFYSWAITDTSGNVKCSVTAVNVTAGGASDQSCTQGTVTLANGVYIFAFTGNATTGKIAYSGTAPLALSSAVSSSTSSSGAMTFPITIPSAGVTYSGYGMPAIILH